MLVAVLLAALCSSTASPASEGTVDTPARPSEAELRRADVIAEGIDAPNLLDAVRLRTPHVDWGIFGARPKSADSDAALTAVVSARVAPAKPDVANLTIIVSDGRAFDRTIDLSGVQADEQPRLVANNIANIVAGIEAGTIEADRDAVPLPVAPTCPECPTAPAPPTCPTIEPEPESDPDLPPPTPPAHAIGVSVGLPLLVGLAGPSDADRFAALAGQLGVSARLRGGATFAIEYRLAGRRSVGDVSTVRNRVAFGGGYSLRRGQLELTMMLLGTVEPWVVRFEGERAAFQNIEREQVLLGLSARVAPGIRWVKPERALSVVLTPFVELSASASPADSFSIPRIVLPGEEASRIRVGGIEVVTGLATQVWFDLRRDGPS